MKFHRSAGAVIFNPENKMFLLLQHRDGHWEFPKGTLEKGESDEDAMLREIEEETGISNPLQIPFSVTTKYQFYFKGLIKKTVVYGLLVSDEPVTISSEHLAFRYVGLSDALSLLRWGNHKRALKKAFSTLVDAGYEPTA